MRRSMNRSSLLLLLTIFSPASALAEPLKDSTPNIIVTGEAVEEAVPDRATIYFGVVTEKPTASEAAAENARAAKAVIDELAAQGVDAKDVTTLNISLEPFTVEERDPKGVLKLTKKLFRARNELSAKIRSLAKAGTIAGQLIDKGANVFQGMEFDVADVSAKRNALRAAAVKDAQRRAETYVQAAELKLGRVLEIRPEPDEDEAPQRPMMRAAAAPMAASMADVPVSPGVKKLTARVTITWALSR